MVNSAVNNDTLHLRGQGSHGATACHVPARAVPASSAGGGMRAVLEALCLPQRTAKSYGSRNPSQPGAPRTVKALRMCVRPMTSRLSGEEPRRHSGVSNVTAKTKKLQVDSGRSVPAQLHNIAARCVASGCAGGIRR